MTDDVVHTEISTEGVLLPADLTLPRDARSVVVFAHGSGSSRLSPRNRYVAQALGASGLFGTLLFDLLSPQEDLTYENRFDIDLLARRLVGAVSWLGRRADASKLPIGLFGASTGAAAALIAAAQMPDRARAVVSRGGRPDLAAEWLPRVSAPTLLIVGGSDFEVIRLNEQALALLGSKSKQLEIVPGATHLFEEPGTLEQVVALTQQWFAEHLR